MENGRVINIVASECQPDQEIKFNKWYNEVHIPMLLKIPGLVGVTRYKLAGEASGQAKYLAVYEFKDRSSFEAFEHSPELSAARDEMAQTWKNGGFDIKWRAPYEAIKTWKK
jgi:antibiotic biosynthesis monooxygenase (ABM) superfamily enzyme